MSHLSFRARNVEYVAYDHSISNFDISGKRGSTRESGILMLDQSGGETKLVCVQGNGSGYLNYQSGLLEEGDFYPYR
jgi:hypothetical protein